MKSSGPVEPDGLPGGARGLLQATTIMRVLIAFAFIAGPAGRRLIRQVPIASQVLRFGEDVPFLNRKTDHANRQVRDVANPPGRLRLPTLPNGVGARANPQAPDGLDLGGDWR